MFLCGQLSSLGSRILTRNAAQVGGLLARHYKPLDRVTHARSMSALYVWQAASKGWAVVESIRQRLSSRFSQVRTVKHTVGSRLLHRV